jgi:hypothetical protein
MLIFRILSGIGAIAFGAAVVLAFPGFSPEVEARTPVQVVQTDGTSARPALRDCTQQAWPYYEANCLRNSAQPNAKPRTVRLVTTDRITR